MAYKFQLGTFKPKGATDLSATGENAANSLVLAAGAIAIADLAADSVDDTKLADDSVNSEHYVDGSIDTQHIADDQITQAKMADDAIGADQLAANAVVNASIASGAAIDLDKLDGGSCASSLSDLAQGDLVYAGDVSDSNNIKSITFSNLEDAIFGNVSGDATIAAGGALTIAAASVENSMLADDAVGADELAANAVVNASIASNAAIDIDKIDGGSCGASLTDLAQGDLLYAGDVDGSNVIKSITFSNLEDAIFGNVSGDAAIAAGGALTIAAGAVEGSMLADDCISGQGSLGGAAMAQADLLLIDDGPGTMKSVTFSNFEDSIFGNISGDAAVAAGGALTIAAGAVEYSMLASAGIKDEDDMASDSASHLVTQQSVKAYVDSKVAGLDVKASVKAVYPASFTMASTASTSTLVLADGEGGFDASANTLTVDGVATVAQGDRVLIKEGVNSNSAGVHKKWNGVYTVGALTGATLTLTRATDFDAASEFVGAPFFMVDDGSTFGAYGFVADIASNPTVGTTAIPFVLFTSPGQDAVAGAGLNKSANVLSVDIDELSALGGTGLHQTQDYFMFSDNGTEKKITFSNLQDAVFADISGDAAVAAGGALTIAADAVEGSMLNDNVISGQTELASDGLAAADEMMISDAGTLKKIGIDNLFKDGPGLLTAAAVAVGSDHIMFLDGGATGDAKIESIGDLASGMASTGISASGGQFSVTPAQTAITSVLNTSLKLGTAADQEYIDFSTSNEIKILVNDTMVAAYEANKFAIQNGAMHYKVQSIGTSGSPSASASISATTGQIVIIYANASQTMTLPAKSGLDGAVFTIKNAGSNSFSLDPSGSEKIEGADQQVDVEAGAAINVVCDSTGWWIF